MAVRGLIYTNVRGREREREAKEGEEKRAREDILRPHNRMHRQRRHRFTYIYTHIRTASSRTPEEARGESRFTFLFRALLFSLRPTVSLAAATPSRFATRRAGERTSTQSATLLLSPFKPPLANPFTPAAAVARHPRCGDGISHSKRPLPLLVAFSYPPRRSHPPAPGASVLARVSPQGI